MEQTNPLNPFFGKREVSKEQVREVAAPLHLHCQMHFPSTIEARAPEPDDEGARSSCVTTSLTCRCDQHRWRFDHDDGEQYQSTMPPRARTGLDHRHRILYSRQ